MTDLEKHPAPSTPPLTAWEGGGFFAIRWVKMVTLVLFRSGKTFGGLGESKSGPAALFALLTTVLALGARVASVGRAEGAPVIIGIGAIGVLVLAGCFAAFWHAALYIAGYRHPFDATMRVSLYTSPLWFFWSAIASLGAPMESATAVASVSAVGLWVHLSFACVSYARGSLGLSTARATTTSLLATTAWCAVTFGVSYTLIAFVSRLNDGGF